MKTHLSLSAMAQELESRMKAKQDFLIDTSKLTMTADTNELSFVNGTSHVMPVNNIAHNQIAQRLEIPSKYYERMRANDPALLATNVNTWLASKKEKRMVRTLNGNVRAFLSDRYNRIENEEIAQTVLPILLQQDGIQIESCAITESRMYIKAVFTKLEGEVAKGDVVQSGVVISNSEVGMGAVSIQPLIYRLVCLNGLILADSKYSARHLGGRVEASEDVYTMLTDETLKADDHAVLLKVRDVLKASLNEARFIERLNIMREAAGVETKLKGNPVEAVKLLAKSNGLNEFEEGSILRNLIEGADLSKWGMVNAITAAAKEDVLSYDRATELETLGGNVLTMTKTGWNSYAMAA